jgi:hypothetical protein
MGQPPGKTSTAVTPSYGVAKTLSVMQGLVAELLSGPATQKALDRFGRRFEKAHARVMRAVYRSQPRPMLARVRRHARRRRQTTGRRARGSPPGSSDEPEPPPSGRRSDDVAGRRP